ncbi:hypothetical protein FN846DRAFT_886184 [Sphaerosporella brunnea]|uniref:Uncharacterized protein n=1 Tax=Sphaerosporella brunnea TaxID=1250544 RepID=A0A5J5FAD7_9PEZI|nr:hypothetical protein FN846DRAFT_886184 [Sphaerosporella brunnea]
MTRLSSHVAPLHPARLGSICTSASADVDCSHRTAAADDPNSTQYYLSIEASFPFSIVGIVSDGRTFRLPIARLPVHSTPALLRHLGRYRGLAAFNDRSRASFLTKTTAPVARREKRPAMPSSMAWEGADCPRRSLGTRTADKRRGLQRCLVADKCIPASYVLLLKTLSGRTGGRSRSAANADSGLGSYRVSIVDRLFRNPITHRRSAHIAVVPSKVPSREAHIPRLQE